MTDLSTLLSRVERGSGADRELDESIARYVAGLPATLRLGHELLGNERTVPRHHPAYTTDLNAVVALVEARLPGWRWTVRRMEPQPGAPSQYAAYVQNTEDGLYHWRAASIAARALLAALIRAEMEKVK